MGDNILTAALQYEDMGFSVIPVSQNKTPLIKWEPYQTKRASKEEIEAWWKKWPQANVAIVCGKISNLLVVDADSKRAIDQIQELLPESMILPCETTPKGMHYFFKHEDGFVNRARIEGEIDVRTSGGYIIVAPSVNGGGNKWQFVPGLDLFSNDLPAMPDGLSSLLKNAVYNNSININSLSLYRDVDKNKKVSPKPSTMSTNAHKLFSHGSRNEGLFHIAWQLFKARTDHAVIREVIEMLGKNCSPPWGSLPDDGPLNAIIESAYKRDQRKDRNLAEEVRQEILSTPGDFLSTDIHKSLHLSTREEQKNLSMILNRLAQPPDAIIKKKGSKRGSWTTIDNKSRIMNFATANLEDTLDIKLPLDIHKKTIFFPKALIVLAGITGFGKCHGKGTKILMFDGSIKNVEDVKPNDVIMGDDSTPRHVLSTTRGYGRLYEVKQNTGDIYTVNEDHVLVLKRTGTNKFRSDNVKKEQRLRINKKGQTKEISIKDYLKSSNKTKHIFKGFHVPVFFRYSPVTLDPYFLGLWLGDGDSSSSRITNADKEVVDFLQKYADELGMKLTVSPQEKNLSSVYRISNNHKPNSVQSILRKMNLLNNKHIPDLYKINSEKTRLMVLAGIVDSDGSLTGDSVYDITLKNKNLAEDTVWLARTLGFKTNFIRSKNINGITYYRFLISGKIHKIPVRIERKQVEKIQRQKDQSVHGIDILPIGEGDYYGFTITGNGRYLLADCTVTHNTSFALNAIKENMHKWNVWYFNAEMSEQALHRKLSYFDDLRIDQWRMIAKEGWSFRSIIDEIHPNDFNVVDYLEPEGDRSFDIHSVLSEIVNKLDKGVALVTIQKKPGAQFGTGGIYSAKAASLVINLEWGKLQITKNRFREEDPYPLNDAIDFNIVHGSRFEGNGDWYNYKLGKLNDRYKDFMEGD